MRGGATTLTADGAAIKSGNPVRLYGASITSGGTGAIVAFRNGTAVTDTILLEGVGVPNRASMVPDIPAEGILFPAGLYVDFDGNATSVTVWAELVHSL